MFLKKRCITEQWSKIRLLEKGCYSAGEAERIVRELLSSIPDKDWGFLGTSRERLIALVAKLYQKESALQVPKKSASVTSVMGIIKSRLNSKSSH